VRAIHIDEVPQAPGESGRSCDQCLAALDEQQRYCIRCGAHQRDAYDPAARYFGEVTRRRPAPPAEGPVAAGDGSSSRWPVVFLALLPVGVALGVLVGKGHNDDQKLIDALRSNHGAAIAAVGPGTATVAANAGGALPSDFPLERGWTVKLSTLPLRTSTKAAVTSAERAAEAKGAQSVGLINPREYTTTPDQGSDSYVIYSGSFKQRGAAAKALAKLKKKFPGAQVIAVKSVNGSSGAGKVLSKTPLGTAHKVEGYKPSAAQVKKDTQLVQDINRRTGQSYIQSQRGLPDQISVGGSPGSAPAPSTGPGQP
jgi:hypothetical protein